MAATQPFGNLTGQPYVSEVPAAMLQNLDPEFQRRFKAAVAAAEKATGSTAQVNSAYRPTEGGTGSQAQAYANYLYSKGQASASNPFVYNGVPYTPEHATSLAAYPGNSRHEKGEAADIQSGPILKWLQKNVGPYGLEFLQGNAFNVDPVHMQLARGSQAPAVPPPPPNLRGAPNVPWPINDMPPAPQVMNYAPPPPPAQGMRASMPNMRQAPDMLGTAAGAENFMPRLRQGGQASVGTMQPTPFADQWNNAPPPPPPMPNMRPSMQAPMPNLRPAAAPMQASMPNLRPPPILPPLPTMRPEMVTMGAAPMGPQQPPTAPQMSPEDALAAFYGRPTDSTGAFAPDPSRGWFDPGQYLPDLDAIEPGRGFWAR